MKQIAVRIGGFVVNAGSQTIVLDRNVDVEKSNARSGNFPGNFNGFSLIDVHQNASSSDSFECLRSRVIGNRYNYAAVEKVPKCSQSFVVRNHSVKRFNIHCEY